jgi:hypothetical protein
LRTSARSLASLLCTKSRVINECSDQGTVNLSYGCRTAPPARTRSKQRHRS